MESREDTPSTNPGEPTPEGFWTRVKAAFGGAPDARPPETKPETPAEPGPATTAARPRKVKRPADDAEGRRRRLERAASEKRNRLALSVGEKVEKVLVEKMDTREEAIGKVAAGFENLNELLHGIGRSLGSTDETAKALRDELKELPEAARSILARLPESTASSVERLDEIARELKDSKGATKAVQTSLEGVPDLLAIAKQGSSQSAERLIALRDVHRELQGQREQRERVVEGVGRVERALQAVAERFQALAEVERDGRVEQRAEAARLERALGLVASRIEEQSHRQDEVAREARERAAGELGRIERGFGAVASKLEAQAARDDQRGARQAEQAIRVERALGILATGLGEQVETAREGLRAQDRAADAFRDTRRAIIETFDENQQRTIEVLRQLNHEHRDEVERRVRRATLQGAGAAALVGAALALAVGAFFPFTPPPRAPVEVAVVKPALRSTDDEAPTVLASAGRAMPTTLRAGFAKAAPAPAPAEVAPATTATLVVPIGPVFPLRCSRK